MCGVWESALRRPGAIFWGVLATSVAWLCLSIYRHEVFSSGLYDLGLFDQIVWNTAHGRAFQCSVHRLHFLGDHFGPALALVAPLYWLAPSPITLLAVNVACVALATWPLVLAAKARGLSPNGVAVVAVAFLAYPSATSIAIYDFHPDLLALPWLMGALYFASTRRYGPMLGSVLLAMTCKEEYAIWAIALGLFVVGTRKERTDRLIGAGLAAFAFAYLLVVIKLVMPRFNPEGMVQLSRYGYLGHGPVEMVKNLFTRPSVFFQQISTVKVVHFVLTFATLGFLPLRRPKYLLLAAPTWAYSLLSTHENQSFLHYQNVVPILPPLFFATIEALRADASAEGRDAPRLARRFALLRWLAPADVLLALGVQWWLWGSHVKPSREAVAHVTRALPADASLSTTNALGPHFAERLQITKFPSLTALGATKPVDFVLLPLIAEGWRYSTKSAPEMAARVRELPQRGYAPIRIEDGVVLFARTPDGAPPPAQGDPLAREVEGLLDRLAPPARDQNVPAAVASPSGAEPRR